MEVTLLVIYGLLLTFILSYSFVQLNLVMNYRKHADELSAALKAVKAPDVWPGVTVQLPVFNEKYVIERLIDATAGIDYPKDKLEIQVLDDGDDESVQLAAERIDFWQKQGVNIKHIHRPDRVGYKAGALAYGLKMAEGEYTAIFDADFIPEPHFLKTTIPHFNHADVGVVQTRWAHLNRDYSTLTRLQAFGLDAHFTVEQVGRNSGGHFMNFNGTAGVWRNTCIEDAGGWQHDTITEDLDLSYRAQLKGWKFIFLEAMGSPAELPAEMNALKNQQYRWTKGAAECAVKNLGKVCRHRSLSISTKTHAVFHLLNSAIFVVILMASLLSIPVLYVRVNTEQYDLLFNLAGIFLLSLFILTFFYRVAHARMGGSFKRFLIDFPLFLSVSMGMSLHNSIAVIQGYLGRKTPFVRTPKFAIFKKEGTWKDKVYRAKKVGVLTFVEALLCLYFIGGMAFGLFYREWGLLPFHLMLAVGFGFVAFQSVSHTRSA